MSENTADFETSDGVRINYFVRGNGPPLLACQGGPANRADTLAAALTPLESTRTVVYHDYRGSGRSAVAPPETYTFERLADDLDELRRELRLGPVPVLAHSMGGFVALNFALRHPEGCAGLILVGTTPTGNPKAIAIPALRALGPARVAKLLARAMWYLGAWAWRAESPRRQAARYAIMATTQEGLPSTRDQVRRAMAGLPAPNDNVARLEGLFTGIDLTGRLGGVQSPALVLYGDRDAVMAAGGDLLVGGLPDVRRIVLPRVGHEPFIEAPEQAFAPIADFLSGLPQADG